MIQVGDKVYVWQEDDYFARNWDKPMGDVISVDGDFVTIMSILDDCEYTYTSSEVFLVGSGPIMDAKIQNYPADEIFEDIPDDPDNVVMNIPRAISAQLGLDIGDTLVVESTKNGLVLRKKEEFPFEEYEQMRAQMIEDSEPYDPDNSEGC